MQQLDRRCGIGINTLVGVSKHVDAALKAAHGGSKDVLGV
jgi:hypothetical protein